MLLIILLVALYLKKDSDKHSQALFDQYKKEAVSNLKKENQKRIEKEKLSKQNELTKLFTEFNLKKKEYENNLRDLEQDIEVAKNRKNESLKNLAESLANEIKERTQEGKQEVQDIIGYYDEKKKEIIDEFYNFTENIIEKKVVLENDFKKAKNIQKEIIQQYKRDEEIKHNKDFYKICLNTEEIEDVEKLRITAKELHNPIVLYKLIYKEYYEKPFNEMIGRVIQGRGNTGIYKITNLKNGKVYIGQTKQTFKNRWLTHLKRGLKAESGGGSKLYEAMWEEGIENFSWEIISECDVTELNEKEKEYISFFEADTWGYNSNKGISEKPKKN